MPCYQYFDADAAYAIFAIDAACCIIFAFRADTPPLRHYFLRCRHAMLIRLLRYERYAADIFHTPLFFAFDGRLIFFLSMLMPAAVSFLLYAIYGCCSSCRYSSHIFSRHAAHADMLLPRAATLIRRRRR